MPQAPQSKRERVEAALAGDPVDRVPVSAWRHFTEEERSPERLAEATIAAFRTFDWDWVKVNPRAIYYAEAWGNRYDFGDYSSVYPRLVGGPIHSADLRVLRAVQGAPFNMLRRRPPGAHHGIDSFSATACSRYTSPPFPAGRAGSGPLSVLPRKDGEGVAEGRR